MLRKLPADASTLKTKNLFTIHCVPIFIKSARQNFLDNSLQTDYVAQCTALVM